MPKFSKTVRAFLAEEGSRWGIVDALAEEMPGGCSAKDIAECRQYLADNGVDKSAKTIQAYRIAGRFVEDATKRQRDILRAQSVTTVETFANRGASQEYAVEAIEAFQAESGKLRMNHEAVRALFARPSALGQTDPDDWNDEQWATFDRKAVDAARTVLQALNLWQRGLYTPSVEAIAQLALLKPQDLDAELASLLEQQG